MLTSRIRDRLSSSERVGFFISVFRPRADRSVGHSGRPLVVYMKSIESAFYKSKTWQKTRLAYIQNVNGLCERCLSKGLIVGGKIVHHRIHLTEDNYKDPEIALNFSNLELLCHDCHNKEHFKTETGARYIVDENGKIIF